MYEVYETSEWIFFVQEICEGGELFAFITERKHLKESEAALIMRQIFSAICYCHERQICHRDLKPENFLLLYKDNIESIKLIDFGLSKKFKRGEMMEQANGTVSR